MRQQQTDQMNRRRHTAVLALLCLATAGCGSHEVTPFHPSAGGVQELDDETPGPSPLPARPGHSPETILVVGGAEDISSSALITADEGGVITAGRHRLTIPAGALKSDVTIQLKDVSGTAGFVSCEAYPEGLVFEKPVLLESSFRDVKDPFGFTIYWVARPGKSNEAWVDMRADLSADGDGLAVWLEHFSTYAPGKAGWSPRRGGTGHRRGEK